MNDYIKKKIQDALIKKNTNTAEVERATGLANSSLRNFLKGRVNDPRFETIITVAKHLDINIMDLVASMSSNFQEQQDSPPENVEVDSKTTPWIPNVLKECVDAVAEIVGENKSSYEDAIKYVEQSYKYAIEHKQQNVDKDFVKWIIKNNR